jgi:hypothetical protein
MKVLRSKQVRSFSKKAAQNFYCYSDENNGERLYLTGVENLKDLSESKIKPSDPSRLKQFTIDLETSQLQPLSSYELHLYMRYHYRLHTRDLSDATSFLKLELIARTFKDLINSDI